MSIPRVVILLNLLSWVCLGAWVPSKPGQQNDVIAFPLREFGVEDPLVLAGPLSEQQITVPVVTGMQPVELTGQIRLSPWLSGWSLEVRDFEKTLIWMPLTGNEENFHLSLANAKTKDGVLNLTLRLLPAPSATATCVEATLYRLEISNLSLVSQGMPRLPETVSEFVSPYTKHLVFVVEGNISESKATAVLQLVSGLTNRVGRSLDVTILQDVGVVSPSPHLLDSLTTRIIRIGEAAQSRMDLEILPHNNMPILAIRGSDDALDDLVNGFLKYLPMLRASSLTELRAVSSEPEKARQKTFAEMGFGSKRLSGSGIMEARYFFSQGDLGTPISGLSLRLAGTTTALPPDGQATLSILVNGGLVESEVLRGGRFDLLISVPRGLIKRDNTLVIRVNYTPPGGECRVGVQPFEVYLDEASYISFTPGQSLQAGFVRFPQALFPSFRVVLEPLDIDTLETSAVILSQLQRLTREALNPQVVTMENAIKTPGALFLVVKDPKRVESLKPVLDPQPFRVLDVDGRELLRVDIGVPFVVLEAFETGGRDVLLLTRSDDSLPLKSAVEALAAGMGWYELYGDVWLMPMGELPVQAQIRSSGLRIEPLPSQVPGWWAQVRIGLLVIAFVLAGTFLVWAYPRVVRVRPPDRS
jgi:hypothetical protein